MRSKNNISLLSLLILITFGHLLYAQFNTNVQFYDTEKGLSHRDVQAIHEDSLGFIWLGTNYGLNRFDGYHFKIFTKEKHGLQSNMINHIVEDGQGWMWLFYTTNRLFKTPVSIDLFNPVTEEVISFEERFGANLPFDFKDITSFTSSEDGKIAFVTNKHQFILYSSEGGFVVSDLAINPITLNCFSRHNTVWATLTLRDSFEREVIVGIDLTLDSLFKDIVVELDYEGKLLNRFEHDYLFQKNYVAGVDQYDNLWYLLKHAENNIHRGAGFNKAAIKKIDPSGNETELPLNQSALVGDSILWVKEAPIHSDNLKVNALNKSFCISGFKHFVVYHPQTEWYEVLNLEHERLIFKNDIFFDQKGRTWVGTEFGLYVIELNSNPFKKIHHINEQSDFQPFRGIAQDPQNNFWVCTDRGAPALLFIESNDNQYESAFNLTKWAFGYKYAIYSDREGFLWFASGENEYIAKYDVNSDAPELIPFPVSSKGSDLNANIWSFHQDSKNTMWFGTDVGVIGYLDEKLSVKTLPELEGVSNQGGCIYHFLQGQNDKTWVATDKGLFNLDIENKRIAAYPPSENLPFLNTGIFHIHEDTDGSFWMGTRGMGLIHWFPGAETYEQFTKADGLSNNTIYAVYVDGFGNLWLTSDYGIMQFNLSSQHTIAFLEKDGIAHNEFNRLSHFQTKDGTLLFGGINGITAFHPKDLVGDSLTANTPIVITGFQQFDGEQNKLTDKTNELILANEIVLNPDDRFFRLEFSLLSFFDLDNIQYAHKVEGVDEEWTYQKENSIRFSRMPYGNHTLRIKSQASNGQWSNQELTINVQVLKPFYLQTWFFVLSGALALILGYAYSQWRVSSLQIRQRELENTVKERTKKIREDKKIIEEQAEELKSLEQLKSRFFANVSHELRTPLTLLLGPINTLLETKKEAAEQQKLLKFVQRNGRQLLKLINEILDLSKLEANKLEVVEEPVLFYHFLNLQLAQFHSFAASVEVNLHADFDPDNDLKIMLDANKFEKILHNFVSNALKFTPARGKVALTIKESKEQLTLKVKDTGKGIHPDDLPHIFDRFYQSKQDGETPKGGTGIGLSLCRELGNLLGGKVWAESELGKGSTFYFQFPKKIASEELIPLSKEEAEVQNGVSSELIDSPLLEATPLASLSAEAQGVTSGPSKATILIVEDNIDLREYLTMILSDYHLITAENGKVGLNCLQQTATPSQRESLGQGVNPKGAGCQLIISDLMMPVMDGFEFMEKVKADPRFSHLPFIVLTAKVNIHAKLKALRIGVDDYLTKPFNEAELIARVENLLENYAARQSGEQNDASKETKMENNPKEHSWLKMLEEHTIAHIENAQFNLDQVSEALSISGRQLQRKLKTLTGLTYTQYLREVRLQKARELLENKKMDSVKSVVLTVGFRDPKYFTAIFKQRFGKTPSDYLT